MKNWKHLIFLTVLVIFSICLAFTACENDPPCEHDWQWVETTPATAEAEGLETETCSKCAETRGTRPIEICKCEPETTHEPDENCCEGAFCECGIAEPEERNFTSGSLFTYQNYDNYFVDIIDMRTKCGSANLEEMGIVDKITDIIAKAYDLASPPDKGRFQNTFGPTYGRAIITIENNVEYEAYDYDSINSARLNIEYLLDTSEEDLLKSITNMVRNMNGMPSLSYANVDVSAFVERVAAQIPQTWTA